MISERKLQQMSELWKKGVPAKWIARAAHCSLGNVYHIAWLHRDMFPYRHVEPDVDPETRKRIVSQVRNKEKKIVEVAAESGIPRYTIHRWLREAD